MAKLTPSRLSGVYGMRKFTAAFTARAHHLWRASLVAIFRFRARSCSNEQLRCLREKKSAKFVADETCCSNARICACTKITGSYGPILVMIVAAGFLVAGVGCSLALIIRELRKAPEGYEDEHGFHTVRNGAVKYGVPDSMKARRTRSSLNWAMHRTLRIKAFRVRGLPFFGKRVPHAASEFSATSRRRAGSCR